MKVVHCQKQVAQLLEDTTMITILLLIIIYLAFISLGLPDSLLGVVWPVMRVELGLPLDGAGLIALASTTSMLTSSLLSGRIIKWLGTSKVVLFSCLMTALALLGYSVAPSFIWFILLALPLGFGAGSVDTALNHYVAVHFKAHHMNWLHSFWGIGATTGPLVMSRYLANDLAWRSGYRTIGIIQLFLASILLVSLPLWKKHKALVNSTPSDESSHEHSTDTKEKFKELKPLSVPGVKYALLTFTAYCTVEGGIGLWGSSYLTITKGLSADTAATWIALYFGGIALGRFLFGFISFKMSNRRMIQLGINILAAGVILMVLPLPGTWALLPLIIIGFGLAPIFPSMMHEAPVRFGTFHAPTIIGYQMAAANIAFLIFIPLIGVILDNTTMMIFPFLLFGLIFVIYLCTTRLAQLYNN